MQVKRMIAGAAAAGLVVAGVLASVSAGAGTSPGKQVVVTESGGDGADGAPDLTRAALSRADDGRLRAVISFAANVTTKSLVAKSGTPGSACMRIYTRATPGVLPPDYLVCATPDAKGKTLRGAVLAEQVNALPKRVAVATVTRSSDRSLVMQFSQTSVGRPAVIQFAAEATRAGCTSTGCVDTLPNAPKTAKLLVRVEAPEDN